MTVDVLRNNDKCKLLLLSIFQEVNVKNAYCNVWCTISKFLSWPLSKFLNIKNSCKLYNNNKFPEKFL